MPPDAQPARQALLAENGGKSNGSSSERSDAEAREGALEGALIAAGEVGYREVSVRAILEHSGWHRAHFYKHFESKEDCFAQAYAAWIERLSVSMLEAAASVPGWQAGLQAALVALFRFATERPAIARALFVEVQIAGEPALARHEAAVERLAAVLDSAREEIEPDEEPPAATGTFVIGGIESCVCEALSGGDPGRLWDSLPELTHFAVGSYFGREAAELAFEEASAMLERERARPREEAG